jgi:site-specific recombinase XerD
MSELTDTFMAQHFALNQISAVRQIEVRRVLGRLETFLGADANTADDNALVAWQTAMIEEGLSPSTCRTYLNITFPFFRWACRNGKYERSLLEKVLEVKPPRGAERNAKPRPYSRAEIAELWLAIDAKWPLTDAKHLARVQRGTAKYRARARRHMMNKQVTAIVHLALMMGLRRKEIFTLSLDAIHPDNAYVVVYGKRQDHREKIRDVPYSEDAREAVTEWFRWRRWLAPVPDHGSPWLDLTAGRRGEAMDWHSYVRVLSDLGDGWELHRLRHTFATERLRAGMPIERLQVVLGHATIQQTLLYTDIDRSDIQNAMERTDDAFRRAVGRRNAA